MTPTEIIIELNNIITTERVQAVPERLKRAAQEAIPHLRKAVKQNISVRTGATTDINGNNHVVKQPCCPSCFEPIMNAAQRHINYCPNCGQAILKT